MGSTHLGRWVGGGLDEYGRPVFDGMDLHGYWAEEEASRAIKELSGSVTATVTATGDTTRHSIPTGTATADTVAISAASR